ncbi:hypothetical protein V496_03620 [Pseudogymnoascus sp. VKM F-4515 (FW-2607)]|nr:hypothetical protein V496_03620 [Pseudogymnoascus sp. VKM F-4515 (FW-2607)]KFZ00350.1 hypothetical protein V498_00147 [Pseudogymnoascus sp. VKM F-4517 (FW-2822)]
MLWSKPVVLASQILFFACLYSNPISAQETSDDGVLILTGGGGAGGDAPTGPSAAATSTGSTGTRSSSSGSGSSSTITSSSGAASTTPPDILTLTGSASTNSLNQTRTSTSTGPQPTNKTPCNLHVEFCNRKYSNITQVCAHNSPFVLANNAAANQAFGVISQLEDGIRMLQIQAHVVNGTVYLCHSSCDILNAGSMTDYLTTVAEWVAKHPAPAVRLHAPEEGHGALRLADAEQHDHHLPAGRGVHGLRDRPGRRALHPRRVHLHVGDALRPRRPRLPVHRAAPSQPPRGRSEEQDVHCEPQPQHRAAAAGELAAGPDAAVAGRDECGQWVWELGAGGEPVQ